MILQVVCSTVY